MRGSKSCIAAPPCADMRERAAERGRLSSGGTWIETEGLLYFSRRAESYAAASGSGTVPGGNCSLTDGCCFTMGDLITM